MHSAIYSGEVRHKRFIPIKSVFSYQLFMMYLDLDELPTLFNPYWLWSVNKPNLASFQRKHHLGPTTLPLKQAVINLVQQQTGHLITGPIRLLTQLQYWGYCFNPISIYYAFDKNDQHVEVIIAEVNNTPWGERHCYVLTPEQKLGGTQLLHYQLQKKLHVSPLLPMDFIYECHFSVPGKKLSLNMKNIKNDQLFFNATLSLQRQEISTHNLARTLLKHPFMTGKVITAIYWQALKLWLKGAKLYTHPNK
jgi:DUF1365 family protein